MCLRCWPAVSFAVSAALAAPVIVDLSQPVDNTRLQGVNPIANFHTERLGLQKADNSASHRDLGFAGSIAGKWYAVYGDTLWCAPGVTDPEQDTPGFHGMVRDSLSALTDDPLRVHDLHLNDDSPVAHQRQFVPFNSDWGETNQFGFGGTSLVEIDADAGRGALFYLVVCLAPIPRAHAPMRRTPALTPCRQNANEPRGLLGASVAKVDVLDGVPTVTERLGDKGIWWDSKTAARYGDIAAYRDPHSDYIYAWGGPPDNRAITNGDWVGNNYVFLARVKAADAFDRGKYEYYWGADGWKSDVLDRFTTETAAMWGTGQGSVWWSPRFNAYVFVHLGKCFPLPPPTPQSSRAG